MTISIIPLDIDTNTFGDMVTKVNQLISSMANNVVTAGGDPTTGTVYLNGIMDVQQVNANNAYYTVTHTDSVVFEVGSGNELTVTSNTFNGLIYSGSITTNTEFISNQSNTIVGTQSYWNGFIPVEQPDMIGVNTIDFNTEINRVMKLIDNVTFDTHTNAKPGTTFIWEVSQDSVGNRAIAFNTDYWITENSAPIELSTTPNAIDIIEGYVMSTGKILIKIKAKDVG